MIQSNSILKSILSSSFPFDQLKDGGVLLDKKQYLSEGG